MVINSVDHGTLLMGVVNLEHRFTFLLLWSQRIDIKSTHLVHWGFFERAACMGFD